MHAPLTCKSACGPKAVHISGVNCTVMLSLLQHVTSATHSGTFGGWAATSRAPRRVLVRVIVATMLLCRLFFGVFIVIVIIILITVVIATVITVQVSFRLKTPTAACTIQATANNQSNQNWWQGGNNFEANRFKNFSKTTQRLLGTFSRPIPPTILYRIIFYDSVIM